MFFCSNHIVSCKLSKPTDAIPHFSLSAFSQKLSRASDSSVMLARGRRDLTSCLPLLRAVRYASSNSKASRFRLRSLRCPRCLTSSSISRCGRSACSSCCPCL
eukprot:62661-Hanusia_phi.AAC.1